MKFYFADLSAGMVCRLCVQTGAFPLADHWYKYCLADFDASGICRVLSVQHLELFSHNACSGRLCISGRVPVVPLENAGHFLEDRTGFYRWGQHGVLGSGVCLKYPAVLWFANNDLKEYTLCSL